MRCSLIGIFALFALSVSSAEEVAPGYMDELYFSEVDFVVDFLWDPSGDLWVASKLGEVYIDRDGGLTLALQVTVTPTGDSGLQAIALDPDYANNGYVWVNYVTGETEPTVRISRFTNVADSLIDETVILDLPWQTTAYNGGCLGFFDDGTLYVSAGMDGSAPEAQNPFSLRGVFLRVNPDGSFPADNPYADGIDGHPAVWSHGVRNPFRCSLQPGTGALFFGDVGGTDFEEVNITTSGENFGYPDVEGPAAVPNPDFTDPLFAYPHLPPPNHTRAAIGGDFAGPGDLGGAFAGNYFFGDHNARFLFRLELDGANNLVSSDMFGLLAERPVKFRFGPGGALYYAAWNVNEIRMVHFTGGGAGGGETPHVYFTPHFALDDYDVLTWDSSCLPTDDDYAIYEGSLHDFSEIQPHLCSTGGSTFRAIANDLGTDMFYLVVPNNGTWEGGFGRDSDGNDREFLVIGTTCFFQQPDICPTP